MSAIPLSAQASPATTRTTISLDGSWDVAESVAPAPLPAQFPHTAPVPGLANLATPPFADVDRFDSHESIDVEIRDKLRPESERTTAVGVPRQARNYFWYRRTFKLKPELAARPGAAILRINKAQFGAAVWLNGASVGEHLGCFTAAVFDVTKALRWKGNNELVVRIGAHPAVLPAGAFAGTDKEKLKWTPGIYDTVSLELSDNPIIESVQVAPHLATSEIQVQTVVRNAGAKEVSLAFKQSVHAWKETTVVAAFEQPAARLAPGERRTINSTLKLPNARLWTPETPNLYVLETATGGDTSSTRFGMREFRYDTATRRAYLNGQLYFLRGSNIALHRFFEDPECKNHPWDEAWVRRLLIDIPRQMHWNSFRFTLGPAPQFWYDVADEAGLLIQNEFPIWQGHWDEWKPDDLVTQFGEWMRDHWNHPSVAVWDASNEAHAEFLAEKVLPAVRPLDLSGRPWDNGYTLPSGPDDPVEDHPYLFIGLWKPSFKPFDMTDLEHMTGAKTDWNSPHPTTHAVMINEYGWLWLNRDGSPTLLTGKVYDKLLGAQATPAQRFETYAYLLAGLTEFWRAHRQAAGVQYFVYLTCSYPGVRTSDNFADIGRLELESHFADYVRESFKPLGVYINFWQPRLHPGETRDYALMLINDEPTPADGQLALAFERDGVSTIKAELHFALPSYGQQTYSIPLQAPQAPGKYLLKAVATHAGEPTVSRRKVEVK
ncbi:MAG: glycosyl hydrolase 2 galactose-binding domain-containing protein [Bryobacteraceae bacterium]